MTDKSKIIEIAASLKKDILVIQNKIDELMAEISMDNDEQRENSAILSDRNIPVFKNAVFKMFPKNRKKAIEFRDRDEFWKKIVEIVTGGNNSKSKKSIRMTGSFSSDKKEMEEKNLQITSGDIIENEMKSKIDFFSFFFNANTIIEYYLMKTCIVSGYDLIEFDLKIENNAVVEMSRKFNDGIHLNNFDKEDFSFDSIRNPSGKSIYDMP